MNETTKQTLNELGFNYPGATFPTGETFDLPVSIVPRGNTTIFLCGNDDAFQTLANHGAVQRNREIPDINGVKYMTVPTTRVYSIFESIARMRLLCSGNKEKVRRHQKLSAALAASWIAALPVERDTYYVKAIAADEFVAAEM